MKLVIFTASSHQMPILQQYNNFYQHSSIFMFGSLSRKEDRMVCLSRRSDHFSKQMVSSPVWWCISGEHQHWGYSPFYRLPRHDHLSGGKMEKLNLSVSLRLTTQRGIFLQNHFLRPTLAPKTFHSDQRIAYDTWLCLIIIITCKTWNPEKKKKELFLILSL